MTKKIDVVQSGDNGVIKAIFSLLFLSALGAVLLTGVVGLITGSNTGWKASDYITHGGECWVRPQGDPLYDAHYANNVNLPNCNAYKTQEQARQIKAQAYQTNVETTQGLVLVYVTLGVVLVILVLITYAVLRGVS